MALVAHKQLWEGDLADGLHRLGLTGITTQDIDLGVGYLEALAPGELTEPTSKPALDAVTDEPAPLVTGTLAPAQPSHPQSGPGKHEA